MSTNLINSYLRKHDIYFTGNELMPDKQLKMYLDNLDVTKFCQRANKLTLTEVPSFAIGNQKVELTQFAGLELVTTGTDLGYTTDTVFTGYGEIVGVSNNTIYLDQNHISVMVRPYGSNTFTDTSFKKGDLVNQITTGAAGDGPTGWLPPTPGFGRSEFLSTYGIWYPSYELSPLKPSTYPVTFPAAGTYYYSLSAVNQGQFTLTGTGITVSGSQSTLYPDTEITGTIVISAPTTGSLTISGTGVQVGSGAPCGFALWIGTGTWKTPTTTIFNTRSPPGTRAYPYATFYGKVRNWRRQSSNKGVLTISVDKGHFRAHQYSSNDSIIHVVGSNLKANVGVASGTVNPPDPYLEAGVGLTFSSRLFNDGGNTAVWTAGAPVYILYRQPHSNGVIDSSSTKIPVQVGTVASYENYSGVIVDYLSANSTHQNAILTQSAHSSNVVGQKISTLRQDVHGNSVVTMAWTAQNASWWNINDTIASIGYWTPANTANTGGASTIRLSGTVGVPDYGIRYSIGDHVADDHGVVAGIFNVPENPFGTYGEYFPSGQKLFKITDAVTVTANSNTSSTAVYTGGPPKSNTVITPPVTPVTPVVINVSSANTSNTKIIDVTPTPIPVVLPSQRREVYVTNTFDPLSQIFSVPAANTTVLGQNKTSYGIYVSSVDLFFAKKPNASANEDQLPVTLRIVTVDKDLPTNIIIAEKKIECSQVNVSSVPSGSNTSTMTKFKFDDPVYLDPKSNYALSIVSESPEYDIFVATLGGVVLGETVRRVSSQPNVGKFFKAQNASIWTPILNQSLMFRLNKCKFDTNIVGSVSLTPDNSFQDIVMDSVMVHTTESNLSPTLTKYKITANNELGEGTDPIYITLNKVINFGEDLITSTKDSTRRRKLAAGDASSIKVGVEMYSTDFDVSPILSKERMSIQGYGNHINEACLYDNIITVTDGGRHANVQSPNTVVTFSAPDDPNGITAVGYAQLIGSISNNDIILTNTGSQTHTSASAIVVTISAPPAGGTTANAYVSALSGSAGSAQVQTIIVDNPGSGYVNTVPTITFNEVGSSVNASAIIRSNISSIILTEPGSGYLTTPSVTISEANTAGLGAYSNATAIISGETDSQGGNCIAKYVTKKVTLASGFDAGDLRVYLQAVRPRGTDINVYYKVKSGEDTDSFESKKWKRMNILSDIYSKDQKEVVEIEYRPDLLKNILTYTENGVAYPIGGKFKDYAIKIVLTASSPTVAPAVLNLIAVATPAG